MCGDGRIDPGEECDDGGLIDCDGCDALCRVEECGNGRRECTEQCDDGNNTNGDGCDSSCMFEPDFCGNGILEMGEECDDGPLNQSIFAIEVSQPASATRFVPDLVSRSTAASFFYGLVSASAHTGYEDALTSNLFLYRDLNTGLVSLFTVHGIDFSTTGVPQPLSTVVFLISGVPAGVSVVISDESFEFGAVGAGVFRGDWNFVNNTDGGVLQGFPVPGDWTTVVQPSFIQGIDTFRWVDEPSFFTPLSMNDVIIEAHSTAAACRLDCTRPTCGDGVWDAGEACDDGNVVSGDRCAADCSSVF